MKQALLILCLAVAVEGCHTGKSSVLNSKNQFLNNPVIAHRGAWKRNNLPQNSIASLKEAIRIGCAGSEFDVHLTADDSLVINHDDHFQGLDIETSTFAQLAAKPLSNGERIPTLREYLSEGIKQNRTKLILEIKKSTISKARTLLLADKCMQMVKELHAQDWIVYISFDYDATKHVKEQLPDAPVQYLNGDVTPQQLRQDHISGLDYSVKILKAHPDWITEGKKLGLITNAWTVNKKEDLLFFLNQHIDLITTNEPELLFELLKNK